MRPIPSSSVRSRWPPRSSTRTLQILPGSPSSPTASTRRTHRTTTLAGSARGFTTHQFRGSHRVGEGVFTAVEAMPAVLARYPRARLRIVGTGGQSAAVADLVARSGLTTQVQLLGHVDEPTLRAVYKF